MLAAVYVSANAYFRLLITASHLCLCIFCVQIARKTVEACRSYLELPHFNKEVIYNKSRAAAGLCEWAINIVKYYDVVSEVEPKRQELAAANATLQEANTTLAAVQQKVRHHHSASAFVWHPQLAWKGLMADGWCCLAILRL